LAVRLTGMVKIVRQARITKAWIALNNKLTAA